MKKYLSALLIVSVIAIGCVRQKHSGLTIEDGVLLVGVEIGYPPMEYYDTDGTTLLGFDIELARALAEKLGLKVKFIDTAWEGIFAGLDTNKYDIAVNITILPERRMRFNFTRPYIDSSMTIAVRKDSPFSIEKPEDIAGYRAAYQGDTTAQYFTERLREKGILFTAFSYDKIINCFNDLELGRVDAVIADNITASFYAEKENSPVKIIWQGPSDEFIGICLKKGNDALTDALNNALEELFEDGTMLEISRKIFNMDLVSSVRQF
ncbi:MAG: ABC transporter substrate-binding protein [Treponema sp.]|nr:ABC transporter substrate-binding protein [Treponema sp.]